MTRPETRRRRMVTISKPRSSGLKDKHGSEIREGDLLKEFWSQGDYTINLVIFDDQRLEGWEAQYVQAFASDGMKVDGRFSRYLPLDWINEQSEIVGNTQENPELRPRHRKTVADLR
jgi:hypothetical protein